ncbi:MAG: SLBB domain-containing protein, partial [Gemmatimonadaceae bacterium]|nr:SLBB domain-containing protein [Gemmatimonadaceae bacterium]
MHIQTVVRSILAVLAVTMVSTAYGQNRPTAAQAEQIAQTNPAVVEQLRQKIMTSGLTPDQVRARLRAEGYDETLLDTYLSSGSARPDSTLSENVFAAVQKLGIADTTEVNFLRCGIQPDTVSAVSLNVDSVGAQRGDSALPRGLIESRKRVAYSRCLARLDSANNGLLSRKAATDSGFVIFGLEFFRNQTTAFDANLSGPVDPSYRVGPGDRLVLVLTGDVEQSYSLDVTREGFLVVPRVGQLWVNNLTLAELENILYARLGRVYSGARRGPGATLRFSITPAKLRSNQIFVMGEALQPGSYRVSAAGTALTALYAARGPNDNGSLRQIEIRRGSARVDVLDVYDYLLKGNAEHDVRMLSSDRIFIPPHGPRVRIVGEVMRPATYELKPGETLADALRFAGGFTPSASRQRVQIERILGPGERVAGGRDRVVTEVVSDELETGTGPSVSMRAGDVVRVFPVSTRIRNRIAVLGNVWSPGAQGITPGMTVSGALKLAGGVKPDTYLGRVLVSRLMPDSTRRQLRAVLSDVAGTVVNDFVVQEDDEVIVYSTTTFRPPRYVAISGAVNKGGQFPFREGLTVRDLVLMAGGLQQSASLHEAEIARLPDTRLGGVTARTFRIPLDSSFLFERGPDGRYFGPPGLPAPVGPSPDVVLQPYDNVLLLRQPGWELQRQVYVGGEVLYPGKYSLKTKTERLSDIIKRAGGITSEGYANGVVFYRKEENTG